MNFKSFFKRTAGKVSVIVSAVLIALAIAVNVVVTSVPLISGTFNTLFGGERPILSKTDENVDYEYYKKSYNSKEEVLNAANNLSEKIAEEGMILLKNDGGALPLENGATLSVFGKNSVNLVYGGSGSGGGNTKNAKTIYDSLEAAGFKYNAKLKAFYDNASLSGSGRPSNPAIEASESTGIEHGETPVDKYTAEVKESFKESSVALVVISRIGGEGNDLPRTSYKSAKDRTPVSGAASADDHYLELDKNELEMLSLVCENFDKVVLIVNSSEQMELGFLLGVDNKDETNNNGYDYASKIQAAVWIGGPGNNGIMALGRILNGEVNPSGRTVDTYQRDFTLDPTWQNFGSNMTVGGNAYTMNGAVTGYYTVEYEEGIYVGYRYYETRGLTDGEEWYKQNVVYPFGYGLSYTSFEWTVDFKNTNSAITKDSEIEVEVTVKNVGSVAGKDVVQLYYTAPYTAGGIEKAFVVLGGFEKTKLLAPNESDVLSFVLKASDMASYDYNDKNGNGHNGYELEKGDYQVKIMRDSHTIVSSATYTAQNTEFIDVDGATNNAITNLFDDVSGGMKSVLSRSDWAGTWPSKPTQSELEIDVATRAKLKETYKDDSSKPYYSEKTYPNQTTADLSAEQTSVKLYDLIKYENGELLVDYNDERWETILDEITLNAMVYMFGTGAFGSGALENIDKPKTIDADGPAGFVNFMGDPSVYNTCVYPSECLIGATFNKALAREMGETVGEEGLVGNENGGGICYSGWYAPAINIHRSPFGGRNFEYYSEDGLLSGKMAAAVISGAQSKGVYTFVKHFALNEQETCRDANGVCTWADEQTMREVYLKAFEFAVKEGKTKAMMASFNRIGLVWTGASYALLTSLLREEWGFCGMVITDFNVLSYSNEDAFLRAGGDLNLSNGKFPATTAKAFESATYQTALRRATKNVLYVVATSNAMNGHGAGNKWTYAMPYWKMTMFIIDGALAAGIILWGVLLCLSMKKSASDTQS